MSAKITLKYIPFDVVFTRTVSYQQTCTQYRASFTMALSAQYLLIVWLVFLCGSGEGE